MDKYREKGPERDLSPAELLERFLSFESCSLTDDEINAVEGTLDRVILDPGSDEQEIKDMAEKLETALTIADPGCDELEDAKLAFTKGVDPRQVVDMVHKFRHLVSGNNQLT